MKYIFIGMLLNSLVTSTHDNLEACKGREALLREKGVFGKCVEFSSYPYVTNGTTIIPNIAVPGYNAGNN